MGNAVRAPIKKRVLDLDVALKRGRSVLRGELVNLEQIRFEDYLNGFVALAQEYPNMSVAEELYIEMHRTGAYLWRYPDNATYASAYRETSANFYATQSDFAGNGVVLGWLINRGVPEWLARILVALVGVILLSVFLVVINRSKWCKDKGNCVSVCLIVAGDFLGHSKLGASYAALLGFLFVWGLGKWHAKPHFVCRPLLVLYFVFIIALALGYFFGVFKFATWLSNTEWTIPF